MKRRNADVGKLRRPIKRTKITEGMYVNSMVYIRFVMLWSTIALADHMLEFRFEFVWPVWMLLKAIHNCYQCKGLPVAVLFTCIAIVSDLVCYYFIPVQILLYLAGIYVWMNSIWLTFDYRHYGAGSMAMGFLIMYMEAWRSGIVSIVLGWVMNGDADSAPDTWDKPFAAHSLGYPAVTIGAYLKEMVDEVLRIRRRLRVRQKNELFYKLMHDSVGANLNTTYSADLFGEDFSSEVKANGTLKRRHKPDANGDCATDAEHAQLHAKLEHLEQHLEKKNRARDASTQSQNLSQTQTVHISNNNVPNGVQLLLHNDLPYHLLPRVQVLQSNGVAKGPGFEDDKNHSCKGQKTKSDAKHEKKEATSKEDKKRKKHRDLDKEFNSHKSTEHTKEQIDKNNESTKECVKVKECNNMLKEREEERKREKEDERKREREERRRREKEEQRRRDKEREKELKEREIEREKERERERELSSARECAEELARVRAALAAAQQREADTARHLAAASDKQRRASQADLKQQQLSTWRCGERALLERKLGEERRARLAAEHQLKNRQAHGECDSTWCRARREAESVAMRGELQRTRERLAQAQKDLTRITEQVANVEAKKQAISSAVSANSGAVLQAEAETKRLNTILSAETRLKLELLAALGDANRKMHIQDNLIQQLEKQVEELKAQMLAVMPSEFARPVAVAAAALGMSDQSPLDPNATIYTPKQLCSDA